MTDTRLSVDVTPASIEANFDALDREVAALVEVTGEKMTEPPEVEVVDVEDATKALKE